MSDHDAAPDPMDKAYAQAEAVLSDEDARAARRARVLAAVGQAAATPQDAPSKPRSAWRRGGWLVAAGVAGLSVFVATRIDSPTRIEQPPAPTTPAVPPATPQAPVTPPTATARPPAEASRAGTPTVPAREATSRSREHPTISPAAPPLEARAPAPPPAAAPPPPAEKGVSDVVVTGSRMASDAARAEAKAAPAQIEELVVSSQATEAARLHAAAAAGRTADVAALLAEGVPVDAPDDDGDTALMKSIRADQPAAAALLRRHDASLDRKNHAGESARSIARSIGDAELNRALGLGRSKPR